jgi:hypothetical protein
MAQPLKRADQPALARLLTDKYFFSVAVRWIASLLVEIPLAMNHITEPQFR